MATQSFCFQSLCPNVINYANIVLCVYKVDNTKSGCRYNILTQLQIFMNLPSFDFFFYKGLLNHAVKSEVF